VYSIFKHLLRTTIFGLGQRPRILLNFQSVAEVFKHIVGEHVMNA